MGYSVYHMHRLASTYGADVNEFVPERWENTDLEKNVGWGFMPFHGGPRICLGSKCPPLKNENEKKTIPRSDSLIEDFALMEASYGIVKIIQTFPKLRLPPEIEAVEPGEERQNLTIVVSSAEGCKVLLQ